MKVLKTILAGWLVFVVGHAIVVAVRARMLAATLNSGHSRPISETAFRAIDGVILAAAFLIIAAGTFAMLNKPKWKLDLAFLVLAAQVGLGFVLYMVLTYMVHIGVGGPL